ncbi:MAG: sigma-70 family RNA polymerase sigma factor [Planctomycetota bacterium]
MPVSPELLCEIWDRCRDRLVVVARGFGEGFEDAVQEAFVELAKRLSPPEDPMAWLVRVTRNRMRDRIRTEGRRRNREHKYAESRGASDLGFGGVSEAFVQRESSQQLGRCLEELPSAEREVVVMHVWGEMSFSQIAAATDRSTSGCHRDYHAALKKIERVLHRDTDQNQSTAIPTNTVN